MTKLVWRVDHEGMLEVRLDDEAFIACTGVHNGYSLVEPGQVVEIDYDSISLPYPNTGKGFAAKLAGKEVDAWRRWATSPEGQRTLTEAAQAFLNGKPSIYYFEYNPRALSGNQLYTRKDIQELVGGEIQTYLPQKDKVILAGCFCRELNPRCPNEIQSGKAEKVIQKAELLLSQPETVFPVFVKELKSDKEYRFIGFFRCIGGSNDREVVSEAESRSHRQGKVSYVLNLVKVFDSAGDG